MNLSVISITAMTFFLMRGDGLGITGRGRRNRVLSDGRRHEGSLYEQNTKMCHFSKN